MRIKHNNSLLLPTHRSTLATALNYVRHLITYWLPPLGWMALIFPFASDAVSFSGNSRIIVPLLRWLFPEAPQDQIEFLHIVARKLGHLIEYGVLAWLLFRAFRADARQHWNWRWVSYSGVMALGWAILDEYAQNFVPVRSASMFDITLDAASMVTVLVALTLLTQSPSKN